MDYTVHGILQTRILEWVDFPFSRGSSQPRDQTQVSHIADRFFTSWATREECSNYHTIALISHAGTVMLKIFQDRLQQYMNQEKADFSKGRGTREQIANIHWIIEKAREFQKNIYFCFIDYTKAFDCVDHNNRGKLLKRREYQTTLPAFWETCMQVKKQQLELDKEQWTGSKLGKEYVKTIYCHLAYLTYM